MSNSTQTTLTLDQIVVDPTVQIRQALREDTVLRYMECWEFLPPVKVFDLGEHLLLADGFHRHAAASRLAARGELNPPAIKADVVQGTREEALEYAVLANAATGEKLTIEERDAGIRRLRQLHPRHAEREIARMMGVHESCVHRLVVVDRVRQEVLWKPARRISDTLVYETGLADRHHWGKLLRAADRRNWTRDDLRRVRDILSDENAPEEYSHKLLAGEADPVPAGMPYPAVTVVRMSAAESTSDADLEEPEEAEAAVTEPQRAGWRDPVGPDVPERYRTVRARLVLEYSQENPEPPRHRGIRQYAREALDVRVTLDGVANHRALDGLGDPRDPKCDHGLAYLLRVLNQTWWKELSPTWPRPPEASARSALR